MPPKRKKGAEVVQGECLRCPTRDAALSCTGGKKCTKTNANTTYWRGFSADPTATPTVVQARLQTKYDCKLALDEALKVESDAKNRIQADEATKNLAESSDEFQNAVNAKKATATFRGHPLSKEVLEHAHKVFYKAEPKKANPPPAPAAGSSKTNSNNTVPIMTAQEAPTTGTLLTNHFDLVVQQDKKLFDYQVSGLQDQDQDFSAPKKKVLLKRLIEKSNILNGKQACFAFNKEGRIIACEALNYDPQKGHETFSEDVPNFSGPNTSKDIKLTVEFKREISLDEYVDYAKGKKANYEESSTKQAIDILVGHHVSQNANNPTDANKVFKIGDNKFFPDTDHKALTKWCMVAMRGFSSNVEAGGGSLLLNVNTAFSAFYKPVRVSEYLARFQEIHESIGKGKKAHDHMIGVRVRIMYDRSRPKDADKSIDDEKRRTKTITGFSTTSATYTKFRDENDQEVSVWKYFRDNHPIEARNSSPNQFCVNTGSSDKGKECWYLPDQLEVVPGQLYRRTLDKLDPDFPGEMIKFASRKPEENRQAIMDAGLPALGLHHGQPMPSMLHNSGITITPTMLEIPFRKIDRPVIKYRHGTVPPLSGKPSSWTTEGQSFVTTHNQITGGIAFVQLGGIEKTDSDHYISQFLTALPMNGIQKPKNCPVRNEGALGGLTTIAETNQLVVFVVEGTSTREPYAFFRSQMDQRFGKASLVLNTKKMKGKNNLIPYMANNMMKVNVRLGNENHLVDEAFKSLFRTFKAGLKEENKCDTLVLGADLIHPKKSSAEFTPSIAALVGSTNGRFTTFLGSARYQDAGQEYIDYQNMKSMAQERIMKWKSSSGGLNPRILYYRDGTGKTQFKHVRQFEIAAIQEAWEIVTGLEADKLKMTTVMVVKRHTTRFFPKDDDEKNRTDIGNCAPGTVVDRLVTEPLYHEDEGQFDFYLQSHDMANIGSAKPTHYFVRENGMKLSKMELEDLTNSFCYNFAHSTNSVSYASPAYYADKLCERTSLYLRRFFDNDDEVQDWDEERQRGEIQRDWVSSEDANRKNPWHKNLDDKMFWM